MATTPTTKTATHKAQTFADRLKAVTSKIDTDMEAGITKLEQVEAQAADINSKLGSVVSQKQADLGALQNVLNQLTNGAPEDEPAAPAGGEAATDQ
jgi:hypothetical protein